VAHPSQQTGAWVPYELAQEFQLLGA